MSDKKYTDLSSRPLGLGFGGPSGGDAEGCLMAAMVAGFVGLLLLLGSCEIKVRIISEPSKVENKAKD